MPIKPKRICSYPGCATLVEDGARCAAHPYPRRANTERPGTSRRGYGRRWQERRAEVLARSPLCQYRFKCSGSPATEVDHEDNDRTNLSDDNLIACCKRCHSYKTATQDRRRNTQGEFR